MKITTRFIVVLLVLVVLLAGCGQPAVEVPEPTEAPVVEEPTE